MMFSVNHKDTAIRSTCYAHVLIKILKCILKIYEERDKRLKIDVKSLLLIGKKDMLL